MLGIIAKILVIIIIFYCIKNYLFTEALLCSIILGIMETAEKLEEIIKKL